MATVMALACGLGLMSIASACSVKGVTYTPIGDGAPVDDARGEDAEAPRDASVIDGRVIDSAPEALGSMGNPAQTCAELRDAGMPSGAYWLRDPRDASAFEGYCEQGLTGGGWAMLENSVRRADGTTLAFWQFPYAERLSRRGAPAVDQNYYHGELYRIGTEYMDVFEDVDGKVAVAAVMTASGIDPATMQFVAPVKVFGVESIFVNQFASGWSAQGHDGDPYLPYNCSEEYSSVAQHYGMCWVYNLGSDADRPYADNGVGPHVHNDVLAQLGLAPQPDGGSYSQVRRIARFTRW